jgi:hypothetical protein
LVLPYRYQRRSNFTQEYGERVHDQQEYQQRDDAPDARSTKAGSLRWVQLNTCTGKGRCLPNSASGDHAAGTFSRTNNHATNNSGAVSPACANPMIVLCQDALARGGRT